MGNYTIQIIFQLLLAAFLGSIIGLEREYKRKEAGLQTYTLVTLGSCLFTIVSFELTKLSFFGANLSFDPLAITQAIAIGIGFIGAGVIFRNESGVVGLTTAAGLWVMAAIGITVGAQQYFIAIFVTLLTLLVFAGFGLIEEKILKTKGKKE